jgi:hypothetical protein
MHRRVATSTRKRVLGEVSFRIRTDVRGANTTSSEYFKGYSKVLVYEYRVKIITLDTLKRYSILSLTLYLSGTVFTLQWAVTGPTS